MKKIVVTLAVLSVFCSCNKSQLDAPGSVSTSNQIVINVHDFTSEDGETKAMYSNGLVKWGTGDILGVVPTNLSGQEATQVKFTLDSEYDGKTTATFNGTGWGMITTGAVNYSSYYPYQDNIDIENIVVSYPVALYQASPGGTYCMSLYMYMYSKPITPSNPEGCVFDFYQLGAISKFTVSVPEALQSKTFVAARIVASDAVFAKTVTYDLTSVTSAEDSKPTFTGSDFYTTVEYGTLGYSIAFAGKSSYVLNLVNAPAQMENVLLTVEMKADDGKWYSGTVTATKNQECGKIYSYSLTLGTDPLALEMNAVDLGLSVLWGDRNVGATSLYDRGNYYAWGADSYTNTTPYWDGSAYTKYNDTDEIKTLESCDDIATITYGDGWRMPTYAEVQELENYCNVSDAGDFGIGNFKAFCVSSKTDESRRILMPRTYYSVLGFLMADENTGYWCSRIHSSINNAYRFGFKSTPEFLRANFERKNRYPIRPVKDLATKSCVSSGTCADEECGNAIKQW